MVFIILESGIEEFRENFNNDLESIIKNQLDLKNSITEMKNTLEGINRIIQYRIQWIRHLKDDSWKSTNQNSKKEKKIFKKTRTV